MRIGIHQPNFLPWFPFFEKMEQSDTFVLLTQVQFEKNSWINRCKVNGKWWTNPVEHGLVPIQNKKYTDGQSLVYINTNFIWSIAKLLGIDITKLRFDFPTEKKGTERIVEICKRFKADEYLTNPDAVNKYLDMRLLNDNNIVVVPFVSKNKKHVFELFDEIGIEATKKLLKNERKKREKV